MVKGLSYWENGLSFRVKPINFIVKDQNLRLTFYRKISGVFRVKTFFLNKEQNVYYFKGKKSYFYHINQAFYCDS